MRWPSGPLEVARRQKTEGFTPEARKTLERWHEPAALEFLAGSPVDCLIVSWAAGLPEDAQQQKTLAPLVAAARKSKLEVAGWVEGSAAHNAAVASAKSAGLSAVVIQGYKGKPDPLVIPCGGRAAPPWDSTAPVLPVTGNVWPGVQAGANLSPDAGLTALPWLDSNGWYIQLARARVRAKVWIVADPPAKSRVLRAQDYMMAVCDSEVPGGRWVVSLDDSLRAGLLEGSPPAREAWQTITNTLAFFQKHSEWAGYRSIGLVGVISDFAGENYDFSGEILNLMARRDLLYRVIWKSQALAAPFTGLKALVYADNTPPAPALRRKMMAFVEQGGLLVTGPKWGSEGKPISLDFRTQFDVRAYGKGRLAVAREALSDPWQVSVDTQFLLSHRNDLFKIYNSSSSGCTSFTASADGNKAVLQALSYASGRSGALRTVWVRQKYRSARLWLIGSEPVIPESEPSEEYFGTEYHLPATAAQPYFALEFEA
jgi:hypothetical protein